MNRVANAGTKASRRRSLLVLVVTFLVAAAMIGSVLLLVVMRRPTIDEARAAFDRGDVSAAAGMVDILLRDQPANETRLLGARLAMIRGEHDEALRLLLTVAAGGRQGAETLIECAVMCGELGRLAEAERFLRMAIAHVPDHPEANVRLIDLLRMEGRNWEAEPFVFNLFRERNFRLKHLELVGTLDHVWVDYEQDGEFLARCESVDREGVLPQLGLIRMLVDQQQSMDRKVEQVLESGIASTPELAEAQATLGDLLLESGDQEKFLHWHSRLPTNADQHPTIWAIRSRWLYRNHDAPAAVRCMWESIKRYPNDRGANLLIAKLLMSLGREEDAVRFQQRGELLMAFGDVLRRRGGRNAKDLRTMIELLDQLDRHWEAYGWCQMLLKIDPESEYARQTAASLEQYLSSDESLTPPSANPALAVDLSSYALPHWPAPAESTGGANDVRADSTLAFHNSASEVGLNFRYFVDEPRMRKAVYSFDFSGGGVGVIDFDCDGWPDLYLTQSRHYPAAADGQEPRNALYRNLGTTFVDVAELARVGDQQFGQGVAVGDFNSDGFPDLYVTNLGTNVLYSNNGDGTFENVTESSGTAGDGYSLSAAMADFNGDGLPDLYVVNYLGDDAMDRQCKAEGRLVQCGPYLFPGQQDQLYLNLGNGQFREVVAHGALGMQTPGRGFGLLVADFDGKNGLDVYVANDMMANQLYLNQGSSDVPAFVEQGQLAGVAYDTRGSLQGSMGIAAADINQDGMLDLYVTNFHREPNNLFAQLAREPHPLFDDLSRDMNLAKASVELVGWGAQFLDAELDGDWDLVVANGDLDEQNAGKMLPNMFENRGPARFEQVPAAGDYFQRKGFGRAVARLDWNQDGLDDLCITHRSDPLVLLTNRSQRRGHYLALMLKGVECSRDAVGAVVEISAGARQWIVPVTAGDGYSASNQKQILVGLGRHERVDTLTIRWPRGKPQVFEMLPADRHWIVVQGQSPRQLPQ